MSVARSASPGHCAASTRARAKRIGRRASEVGSFSGLSPESAEAARQTLARREIWRGEVRLAGPPNLLPDDLPGSGSIDEAIEWVKRCPNPTGHDSELEIRQVFEAEDFGAEFTPELRAREEQMRKAAQG